MLETRNKHKGIHKYGTNLKDTQSITGAIKFTMLIQRSSSDVIGVGTMHTFIAKFAAPNK